MKKLIILIVGILLLVGCGSTDKDKDVTTLKISATAIPHEEILKEANKILEEEYNIKLDILVTDDYYIPNKALNDGDVDANFFQHIPFFEGQKEELGYKIVNAGAIHIEPIGIYSKKYSSIDEIADGSTVIISNSVADHGRVLAVFQEAGLIKIKDGVETLSATISDIASNPKNLVFRAEIAPELLATSYLNDEADLVAINSNYALSANLNPLKDSLIIESSVDNPYVNIVAVKEGNENNEAIKKLVEVLRSKAIQDFIISKYSGSVVPAE